MALAYGVSLEEIRYALVRFHAVEHRIEYVTEKNGVPTITIPREPTRMQLSRAFRP